MPLHAQLSPGPRETRPRPPVTHATFCTWALMALLAGVVQPTVLDGQDPDSRTGREPTDRTLVLTLRSYGFENPNIRVEAGKTYLRVRNRTLLPDLVLTLDRQEGAQRQQLSNRQVERSKPVWREIVNLTPGEYIVSVDGHPKWQANLTVVAKGGR